MNYCTGMNVRYIMSYDTEQDYLLIIVITILSYYVHKKRENKYKWVAQSYCKRTDDNRKNLPKWIV